MTSAPLRAESTTTSTELVGNGNGKGKRPGLMSDGVIDNNRSSYPRRWVTVHDSSLPVDIVGTIGAEPHEAIISEQTDEFQSSIQLTARVPVAAVQVRLVLFDIWGRYMCTLADEIVHDISPGDPVQDSALWRWVLGGDVRTFNISIAYISRVRLSSGQLIEADPALVLEQARKLGGDLSAANLEPTRPQPPGIGTPSAK